MGSKLLFVATLLLALGVSGTTQPAYASEHALYTVSGFVELLIDKGLILEHNHARARELGSLMALLEGPKTEMGDVQNAQHVEVYPSQYIQNSKLEFAADEDIKGILLLAKNVSDKSISLDAQRGCQVVYKIFSKEEELLYDSSVNEECQTNERVTYHLDAGQARMFEITHTQDTYRLASGTYTFELEYPGYGIGTRTVTVY